MIDTWIAVATVICPTCRDADGTVHAAQIVSDGKGVRTERPRGGTDPIFDPERQWCTKHRWSLKPQDKRKAVQQARATLRDGQHRKPRTVWGAPA